MDGSTDSRRRQDLVTKFNGDPPIDCLGWRGRGKCGEGIAERAGVEELRIEE
jgi:hypothetical protein